MLSFPLAIILIVVGIPVLCGTVIAMVAILRPSGSKRHARLEADETRLIQELHQAMTNLEQRIETLETVIMERERSKETTR